MNTRLALTLFALLSISCTTLNAATVGYWRFEDSSDFPAGPVEATVGDDLSIEDTVVAATGFPNPVPLTGATNTGSANLGNKDNEAAGGYLFNSQSNLQSLTGAFTFEAFVNLSDNDADSNYYVGSLWEDLTDGSDNNDRRWALGVKSSVTGTGGFDTGELFVLNSPAGTSTALVGTDLILSTGTNYYVALALDGSTGNGTVYLQDLSSNTLQSATITGATVLASAMDDPFAVGRLGADDFKTNRWSGLIDEVRISDMVLSQNELLVSATIIPEPSTGILLGLPLFGLLVLAFRCRRRQ